MKKRFVWNSSLFIVFLLVSIIPVWLFARTHMVLGAGDLMFHANRMEELYQDVSHGVLIPRISTYSFNEVGSGINFFYPWFFLYPFVIFRFITHNPISAYYCGLVLESFATLYIAYYSMHRYSRSTTRAFVFAILYSLANYRIYLVYNQDVLAESLGYMFMPLALVGFYETFFRDKNYWPLLGLGMALILLSHMLTTALIAIFFLITLIVFWRNVNEKNKRLIGCMKAVVLCISLAAFYLLPFFEQTFGNYIRASWTGFNFVQQPMEVIETSINNVPNQVVGLFLILALLLGWAYVGKVSVADKYTYFAGLVLVVLTTKLMPWGAFLHTPLANLQFPYRLDGLATLMLTIYLSTIINKWIVRLKSDYRVSIALSLCVVIIVTLGVALQGSYQVIHERRTVPVLSKRPTVSHNYAMQNNGNYNLTKETWRNMFYFYGHNGAFDYMPLATTGKAANGFVAPNKPLHYVIQHQAVVNGKKVSMNHHWFSHPNGMAFDLRNFKAGTKVELPILYYKHDVVKVGNGKFETPVISKAATVTVTVPVNHKQAIVKYQDSLLDRLSLIWSILSWLLLTIIFGYKRGRKYVRIS